MRGEARSVMGKTFQMTLPSEWRNEHGVGRGDKVYAHYEPDSLLIIAPREGLSELEDMLIDLLILFPGAEMMREKAKRLRDIANRILQEEA